MRIRGVLFWLCTLTISVAVLAGFAGRIHPIGDSFAAFRLHFGAAAMLFWVWAALSGRLWAERVGGVTACLALGSILWVAVWPRAQEPEYGIAVFQHNMLFRNETIDAVIAQVEQLNADIVLLQEVLPEHRALLEQIETYSTIQHCDRYAVMNNVILSKWPAMEVGCHNRASWAQISTPVGPVTFVSLHLPWPWPASQELAVERLIPVLGALPQPVVLGGDYNSAPWSNAVSQLANAADVVSVPGLRLTFADPRFWPGLPIDHIHMPRGWIGAAQMVGQAGSDHRGTFAMIGPVPEQVLEGG